MKLAAFTFSIHKSCWW